MHDYDHDDSHDHNHDHHDNREPSGEPQAAKHELLQALQRIAAGVTQLTCHPLRVRADLNDADVENAVQALVRARNAGVPQSSQLVDALGRAPR